VTIIRSPTPPHYAGLGGFVVGGARYRGAMLGTGPVGYWRLGDGAGSGILVDTAGTRNGTRTGGTLGVAGLLTGDPDTAYALTAIGATGGQVTAVAGLQPTGGLSISAWFRYAGVAGAAKTVIRKGAGALSWWMRRDGADALEYRIYTADQPGGVSNTSAPIVDTNVHFGVATYDGAFWRNYLDNILIGATPATGAIVYDGDDVGLGMAGSSGAEVWNGTLDEEAMHNRALSVAEINTLYRAGFNL
jgi:hypothetical protein